MEIWKDVEGYEGLYQVNQFGEVKSLPKQIGLGYITKEKILKPRCNNSGYLIVNLSKDGKGLNKTVHRLVAKAFIPNPEGLPEIDHIDGDKTNNVVENLQWISHVENNRKKTTGIGIPKRVENVETGEIFETMTAAADKYNVSKVAISNAVKRGGRSAGYHWRVIE